VIDSKVFRLEFLTPGEREILAATVQGAYVIDAATGKGTPLTLPEYKGPVYFIRAESNGDSLFAGSDSGLFISRDGGSTWRLSAQGLPTGSPVQAFERMPQDNVMLVGTRYGLYRSADDGEAWTKVNQGIPSIAIGALKISTDGRTLYAANSIEGNIYASRDKGASWSVLTRQINSSVSSMAVNPADDLMLLLSSVSDGILSLRLTSPSAVPAGQQN
jgi:photosystem II stability/assembly factor-like uncharacterized protein